MSRTHPRLLSRGSRQAAERIAPGAVFTTFLVVVLALAGLTVVLAVPDPGASVRAPAPGLPPQPARRAEVVKAPVATPLAPAPARAARAPRPVRISIPAIGVSAPVIPLGLDRERALEVPEDFDETGWWTGGSRPGEPGPAVIAGHVDSHTGPAVFFRIGALRRGDAIVIERADGSRVRFRVQRSARYSKSRFPSAEVYGATRRPALRLVTCSGTFDRSSGHYLDNTVVYAGT